MQAMTALEEDLRQKVLVVDDEHFNRKMLSDILRADYTVVLAKNGEQAIERALSHQPDLILLDIVMPGHSGYEVLERLKSNPFTRDIPVIFISALDSADEEEKGLRLGAADYIAKPFRPFAVLHGGVWPFGGAGRTLTGFVLHGMVRLLECLPSTQGSCCHVALELARFWAGLHPCAGQPAAVSLD